MVSFRWNCLFYVKYNNNRKTNNRFINTIIYYKKKINLMNSENLLNYKTLYQTVK